jgi:hypothetical protein
VNGLVARYRAKVALKRAAAAGLSLIPTPRLARRPAVTIFITTTQNRYPLQLTIETLVKNTRYDNYEIVVAHMGASDGSVEYLQSAAQRLPLVLRRTSELRPQHEWYDEFLATASTEYWVGMHDDIFFLGRDWLLDMISVMEQEHDLYLLGGEYFPPNHGMAEPVSGETIDLEESLSTWLFCVRTSLREHVDTSFEFHKIERSVVEHGRLRCYDVGGKVLADMRTHGLRHASMPRTFRMKWQHIGNLSYWSRLGRDPIYLDFKRFQIADAKRRVLKLIS